MTQIVSGDRLAPSGCQLFSYREMDHLHRAVEAALARAGSSPARRTSICTCTTAWTGGRPRLGASLVEEAQGILPEGTPVKNVAPCEGDARDARR